MDTDAAVGGNSWRQRAMLCLAIALYLLAPFTLLAVQRPAPIDFWWDYCMALGLAAAAALAVLPLLSARWWAPQYRSAELLRVIQYLHRQLSYVLLALLLGHVIGLIVLEQRVVDYLLPTAPGYMLAGLAALLLVLFLILSSRYRAWLAWAYPGWRRWHAGLSAIALGLLGWHVWESGFYFSTAVRLATGGWLLAVPTVLSLAWHRWPDLRPHARREQPTLAAAAARRRSGILLVYVLSTVLLMAAGWLAWRGTPAGAAHTHPYPCPAGRCL